jgi:hypothetical protein
MAIRSTLDKLPQTLDETYERTLLGIDKEKQIYAIPSSSLTTTISWCWSS